MRPDEPQPIRIGRGLGIPDSAKGMGKRTAPSPKVLAVAALMKKGGTVALRVPGVGPQP